MKKSGFSVVELLVSLGISAAVMSGIAFVLVGTTESQTEALQLRKIEIVRRDFLFALNSEAVWGNIIASPENASAGFNCLISNTPCTMNGTPGGQPITNRLFSMSGYMPGGQYNSANPAVGLDNEGLNCNGYSAAGNDRCPFRFDFRWSAVCRPGGSCVNPQVKVTAAFLYSPEKNKIMFDPAAYSIELYRTDPLVVGPPPPPPPPTPPPGPPPGPPCWSAVETTQYCGSNWINDTYLLAPNCVANGGVLSGGLCILGGSSLKADGCPWVTCNPVAQPNLSDCSSAAGNNLISVTCSGGCCDYTHQNCSAGSWCP